MSPVFGNTDNTDYCGFSEPFPFPSHGLVHVDTHKRDWQHFYRDFESCGSFLSAVPVHRDCFEIFGSHCSADTADALSRIWTLGVWSTPWPAAAPLGIEPRFAMSREVVDRVACQAGFPQFCRCPVEILDMIRAQDPHSWFWRAVSTLTVAADVLNTPTSPNRTLPLAKIESWERGGQLTWTKTNRASAMAPRHNAMILTLDAHGVTKIERVQPGLPSPCGPTNEEKAYIVMSAAVLPQRMAHLKDGVLRLDPPPINDRVFTGREPTLVWDTPFPPVYQISGFILSATMTPPVIVRTFELAAVTGITFFFRAAIFVGAHAHDGRHPTAQPSFDKLCSRFQQNVTWVYLPVAQTENPIETLGVRQLDLGEGRVSEWTQLLIHKRHSGTTTLGNLPTRLPSTTKTLTNPATLIVGIPYPTRPLTFLGAAAASTETQPEPPPPPAFEFPPPEKPPQPQVEERYIPPCLAVPLAWGEVAYSAAALGGVKRVEVFFERRVFSSLLLSTQQQRKETREVQIFCGVVLWYADGGCRAVGHVRVGVDESRVVEEPRGVEVRRVLVDGRWYVEVVFVAEGWGEGEGPHGEDELGNGEVKEEGTGEGLEGVNGADEKKSEQEEGKAKVDQEGGGNLGPFHSEEELPGDLSELAVEELRTVWDMSGELRCWCAGADAHVEIEQGE